MRQPLLCPNHHELIDELEPERWNVDDLLDMKAAHEGHRPGDRDWCTDEAATTFVAKLAVTNGYVVLAAGAPPPREPIRSGSPMPKLDDAPKRIREEPSASNAGREFTPVNPDWPRGARRVRDLANELGLTQRAVMDVCEALGIPARGKDTRLSEPYADMIRRRARRDREGRRRP